MIQEKLYDDALMKAIDVILSCPTHTSTLAFPFNPCGGIASAHNNIALEAMGILSQYCWWSEPCDTLKDTDEEEEKPNIVKLKLESSIDTVSTSQQTPKTKSPKKKSLPNIEAKIRKVLEKIHNGSITEFKASKKKVKGFFSNRSGRRSKYIGVSKNNYNWQVLINVGNRKKYIGTFPSQKEAAVAYDFYSIALHGERAKTNFNYSNEVVEEMVMSCLNSCSDDDSKDATRMFDPCKFTDRV